MPGREASYLSARPAGAQPRCRSVVGSGPHMYGPCSSTIRPGRSMALESPPITSFDDDRLFWMNGSNSRTTTTGKGGQELTLCPEVSDYWCRTFYGPPALIKTNAPSLMATLGADEEKTLSVAFTLKPAAQFDQAGALIFVSVDCWLKCGIEFCDGQARLSTVVTNDGFSDWSTQLLPFVSLRLRVTKLLPGAEQGPAVVVEAAPYEDGARVDSPGDWQFVRICSLRGRESSWAVGAYAAAPVAAGLETTFHYITIGPKEEPSHSSDLPGSQACLPCP